MNGWKKHCECVTQVSLKCVQFDVLYVRVRVCLTPWCLHTRTRTHTHNLDDTTWAIIIVRTTIVRCWMVVASIQFSIKVARNHHKYIEATHASACFQFYLRHFCRDLRLIRLSEFWLHRWWIDSIKYQNWMSCGRVSSSFRVCDSNFG